MDELDNNLLAAWHRVFELCQRDPVEARRRYERTLPGTCLDRPHRAWCVALRASDTRLNGIQGAVLAPSPSQGEGWDEGGGFEGPRLTSSFDGEYDVSPSPRPSPSEGEGGDRIGAQTAHEIVIDGGMIAELGGPVDIPHPGVPLAEAARLLGRDYRMMRRWLPVGAGRSNRERDQLASRGMSDGRLIWATFEKEGYPLKVRYEPPGRHGRNGREVPVVWSDGPLDPGAKYGKPPSRWWGTLWQSMAKGIPTEFEQVLVREPRWLPVKGQMRFRGWLWRCPGLCSAGADLAPSPSQGEGWDEGRGDERPRLSANVHDGYDAGPSPQPSPWEGEGAKASACGKLVRTLYAPLPVWTIGRYLGLNQGLGVEGLAGQWLPGVMDRWAGRRSLACLHCWRVRDQGFSSRKGWNELVAHLSGGLLFGHEVEQPSDFEYERRRAYVKRAQKRPQIDRAVIGGAAPIASMQAALSAPPPGDQQAAQAE